MEIGLAGVLQVGQLSRLVKLCPQCKQVLLKVIWEEGVAPRWIKRVANYWDCTALDSSMLSPFKMSRAELDSAGLGDSAYASVCRCTRRCTLYCSKMSACYIYSLHGRIAMLRLFHYVFALEFIFNPQFDLTCSVCHTLSTFVLFCLSK